MRRDLDERLLEYSARVMKLVDSLPKSITGKRIGEQLLRSAISVGANYEEAQAGESRADFAHKLQISLKELRESNYWLRLILRAALLPEKRMKDIIDESNQLRAILSKAVSTTKKDGTELR